MRSPQSWRPTKFELRGGHLRGSRNAAELGVGSRLVADLVAGLYARDLPKHVRGRLLDLGCGKVPLYGTYRDLASAVTCIDWSDDTHVDLVCDLSQPLPLGDASFDTVVVSDVMEHLPDPALAWREIARVLAPGGTLLLNVPFLYPIHAHPHDHFRYTCFALDRFARGSGLEPVTLEPVGGLIEVLADISGKALARLPVIGPALAAAQQALASAFVRTSLGRRLLVATARNYPLGYFLVAVRSA